MERIIIKGDSTEDCLDSIDLVLQSWATRLGTHIIGIIPPVPILHHQKLADSEGCIFAGIIPFTGKISKAFLAINKYNVKPITVEINIYSEITHAGARFECDKPIISYLNEVATNAGDIVRIRITPVNGAEEFLVGLLCHPEVTAGDKEARLISELRMLDSMKEL